MSQLPELDLTLECDGGCRNGNPGQGSYGFVALGPWDDVVYEDCGLLPGKITSNEAEGLAIIKALEFAKDLAYPQRIELRSDSKTLIRNLQNYYRFSKSDDLNSLLDRIQGLMDGFDRITLMWVPRRFLKHPHELASAAFLNERKQAAIRRIKRSDFEPIPFYHLLSERDEDYA